MSDELTALYDKFTLDNQQYKEQFEALGENTDFIDIGETNDLDEENAERQEAFKFANDTKPKFGVIHAARVADGWLQFQASKLTENVKKWIRAGRYNDLSAEIFPRLRNAQVPVPILGGVSLLGKTLPTFPGAVIDPDKLAETQLQSDDNWYNLVPVGGQIFTDNKGTRKTFTKTELQAVADNFTDAHERFGFEGKLFIGHTPQGYEPDVPFQVSKFGEIDPGDIWRYDTTKSTNSTKPKEIDMAGIDDHDDKGAGAEAALKLSETQTALTAEQKKTTDLENKVKEFEGKLAATKLSERTTSFRALVPETGLPPIIKKDLLVIAEGMARNEPEQPLKLSEAGVDTTHTQEAQLKKLVADITEVMKPLKLGEMSTEDAAQVTEEQKGAAVWHQDDVDSGIVKPASEGGK